MSADATRHDTSGPTGVLHLDAASVTRGGEHILTVEALRIGLADRVGLIGPNGAGKSTLLRLLGGLQTADDGSLSRVDLPDEDEAAPSEVCAVVLQRPLLRRGTVIDNVAIGLRFRGVGRAPARDAAREWLERFGVADLAGRRARTLSGGEAARVSLARALAVSPRLLLLDEPFAALDERSRGPLVLELGEILEREGIGAVLVTHDRREAAALADRLLVLDDGRVVADGPSQQVLADERLADLLGGAGVLDAALAARLDTQHGCGR